MREEQQKKINTKVKKSGKYLVQIYAGKAIRVGLFDTAIQAALAYDQAAIKAGKKKSVLNFPDGLPVLTEGKQARISKKAKKTTAKGRKMGLYKNR